MSCHVPCQAIVGAQLFPPLAFATVTTERKREADIWRLTQDIEKVERMGDCRVLIVEDDPLVSSHLESIITRAIDSHVIVGASIAEANAALAEHIDFAVLDVDVLDGTTYAFAATLSTVGIPFAFVSASNRDHVPVELKTAPFVTKPYTEVDIFHLLKTLVPQA